MQLGIAAGGQRDEGAHHALGVEALVHAQQPVEAAHSKPAPINSANESATSATMSTPRSRWRAGPETVPRAPSFITAREVGRSRAARQEAEQSPVASTAPARRRARARRWSLRPAAARCRSERARRGPRLPDDQHADNAAQQREQQALNQELAHQARARRTQRRAHRDLALPRRRAREQEVAHLGARDEEQHRHRAGQREEKRARSADHEAVERDQPDAVVGHRLLLQAPRERRDAFGGGVEVERGLRPTGDGPGSRRA